MRVTISRVGATALMWLSSTVGRSFRLLNNTTMMLRVRPGSDRDTREAVLNQWYRGQLRSRLPALLAKWELRIGVRVGEVRIKKMKTLWGSCNKDACRIWLNLELAKKQASASSTS